MTAILKEIKKQDWKFWKKNINYNKKSNEISELRNSNNYFIILDTDEKGIHEPKDKPEEKN